MGTDKEAIVRQVLKDLLTGAKRLAPERSAAVLLREACLKAISTGYKPEKFQEAWELLDVADDLQQVVALMESWIEEEQQ